MADTHPDLISLFVDPDDARRYPAGSGAKCAFVCERGHQWTSAVVNVIGNGTKCPYCTNRRVLAGFNDVATTHPEKSRLIADPEDARRYTAGSRAVIGFRCKKSHEWTAPVSRVFGRTGSGCPYCSGQSLLAGINDAATTHPERVSLFADPDDATRYTASSSARVAFRCSKGHDWIAHVFVVVAQGRGCGYCANRLLLPGFNDVATTHPWAVAFLQDPSDAQRFMAGSGARVDMRCSLGHEFTSQMTLLTRRDGSSAPCPYCSGDRLLPGFNDVATTHPHRVHMFADPLDAARFTASSTRPALFTCSNGHVWTAPVYKVIPLGVICSVCRGRTVVPGVNDAATTHPDRAVLIANQADARRLTAGANVKVEFQCLDDATHRWTATVNDVVSKGHGCPSCASGGFDQQKPASFYVLRDVIVGRSVIQFGVSNVLRRRLREHRLSGFVSAPIAVAHGPGHAIYALERQALAEMAARGVPSVLAQGFQFTNGGASEAFYLDEDQAEPLLAWLIGKVETVSAGLDPSF